MRPEVFIFVVDYIDYPVHSWSLLFAYLTYGGFGLVSVAGLWFGKSWGQWTYCLHVLSGTINFNYGVIPVTPGFDSDYLYLGWILGGNVLACIAVMACGKKQVRR